MIPPPLILSLWTILNDDHGDYVLVIPARSLKECPCCVLNTQWRDYADPYMWCCGCIPPVRLNPICYRFGLKKRGAASTRGWVGGFVVLYSCFTVHSTSSISWGIRAKPPFGGSIFYLCVLGHWKRTLACVKAVCFFFLNSLFIRLFLFFLCGRGKPKSP